MAAQISGRTKFYMALHVMTTSRENTVMSHFCLGKMYCIFISLTVSGESDKEVTDDEDYISINKE